MRIYTRIKLVKCVSWDDCKYPSPNRNNGLSTEWSVNERADLIILATLVFYTDVGCFQYIVKVGLVSTFPIPFFIFMLIPHEG